MNPEREEQQDGEVTLMEARQWEVQTIQMKMAHKWSWLEDRAASQKGRRWEFREVSWRQRDGDKRVW